jgi:hypothetical protein
VDDTLQPLLLGSPHLLARFVQAAPLLLPLLLPVTSLFLPLNVWCLQHVQQSLH